MPGNPASEGAKLAFLAYVQGQDNAAGRGALLVTDEGTRPLEFRCTTPIQPNPLQRMLYGETLKSYIAAELVGEPLLAAVQEKPTVIIVTEPLFFGLRSKINTTMVCLRRQGEQISAVVTGNGGTSASAPALLSCASGRFQPLTVTGPPDHSSDLETALEFLRPVFSDADLLEPFSRIEKVVAELNRQESVGGDKAKSK